MVFVTSRMDHFFVLLILTSFSYKKLCLNEACAKQLCSGWWLEHLQFWGCFMTGEMQMLPRKHCHLVFPQSPNRVNKNHRVMNSCAPNEWQKKLRNWNCVDNLFSLIKFFHPWCRKQDWLQRPQRWDRNTQVKLTVKGTKMKQKHPSKIDCKGHKDMTETPKTQKGPHMYSIRNSEHSILQICTFDLHPLKASSTL